jgi:hypothetical protein
MKILAVPKQHAMEILGGGGVVVVKLQAFFTLALYESVISFMLHLLTYGKHFPVPIGQESLLRRSTKSTQRSGDTTHF